MHSTRWRKRFLPGLRCWSRIRSRLLGHGSASWTDRSPPERTWSISHGNALTTQIVDDGTLVEVSDLAAYSVAALSEVGGSAAVTTQSALSITQAGGQSILENALLRVEINATGDITRIYDKQAVREVLSPDAVGNALLAFEDRPLNFDAWDIDIFYEDRTEKVEGVESITITERGPLRVALEIKRDVSAQQNSPDDLSVSRQQTDRLRDVDRLVRTAYAAQSRVPGDVLSPTATFEVQWGNVQRVTHRNTSWDWARFETCAHKWADLSEGNYGVALLNDCKYGYDIHDNVIRLSLLKSATSPDPQADQGEHRMTYSLLPHVGDWRTDVVPAAYDLNDPLILRRVTGGATDTANVSALTSLVSVSAPNVIIETVKYAEDGNGLDRPPVRESAEPGSLYSERRFCAG